MRERGKGDWLDDIDARQRNLAFPDTVRNEGRFWRNIWAGKQPLNFAQWIGPAILFLFFGGSLLLYLRMLWPEGLVPWWQKVIAGYGVQMAVVGVVVVLIVIGDCRARRGVRK